MASSSSNPPTGDRLEEGSQGPLSWYATTDPATRGEQYWHLDCPDPLGNGYDGLIWGDDAGNLSCQNCGLFAPAPGAPAA